MSNIIPFNYQGEPVRFNSDGWINATDVARRYGKRPVDWLKQSETRRYMNVLAAALNCDPGSLLETRRGRHQGGTWLHPKMAVAFARWLDLEFAVWCDLRIDALLRGDLQIKENYSSAQQALLEAKTKASKSGAELASWRWSKGSLQQQVEYWGGQLSLILQGQNDDYEGF